MSPRAVPPRIPPRDIEPRRWLSPTAGYIVHIQKDDRQNMSPVRVLLGKEGS